MGRRPCCAKEGLNRGAWTTSEDRILTNYITTHGEGKWRELPQKAGLKRCGKSCRLRWLNYLRPDIKRGNISEEEAEIIIKLHNLLGNRWSLIAGRLPGRTDNEIKNYWNTNLSKRLQASGKTGSCIRQSNKCQEKESTLDFSGPLQPNTMVVTPHQVIKTKAMRCNKVVLPMHLVESDIFKKNELFVSSRELESSSNSFFLDNDSSDFLMDFNISDLLISDFLGMEFHQGGDQTSTKNCNEINGFVGEINMNSETDW